MTILDRARDSRRAHIDLGRFAEDLTRHVPDLDRGDIGKAIGKAVHDASDRARTVRSDLAGAADRVQADNPLDRLGRRFRALASTSGIRTVLARLERELPDTDTDRYARAYARGRTQARSGYLVAGIAVGVTGGVLAAILLDPKHGRARRRTIGRTMRRLTSGLRSRLAGKAKFAGDRARGMAIERGLVQPSPAAAIAPLPPEVSIPVTAPWPTAEGPVERPLADPAFGAHEALPEELVSAASTSDPTEPAVRD